MDIYTTIVVGIAVLLAILLYIIFTSVRELRKPVESTTPEPMKLAEIHKPIEEPIVESSGLTIGQEVAMKPFFETEAVFDEFETEAVFDERVEAGMSGIVIEPALSLDEADKVESIIETRETIDTPRPGWNILDIEGIGSKYAKKLIKVEIKTTADLLEAGSTPSGREELAEKIGISPKRILEWVNLSDLLRIKGVGEEYSDLLEEAGVNTVPELAKRNPESLYAKITELNEEKQLVRRVKSKEQVTNWIEYAKKLPGKVEY